MYDILMRLSRVGELLRIAQEAFRDGGRPSVDVAHKDTAGIKKRIKTRR